ncbi:MAG: hypothetical protein LQ337_003331 [Flavoplaca oasis]|nr:MAG: hypothetical protein LQ337_003331 [Flavoplaca oasis]
MSYSIFVYLMLIALVREATQRIPTEDAPHLLRPKHRLMAEDDPRFSMRTEISDTKLPATPVLMCAIELAARYAEMDYLGRTSQRHGIVLPQYPQIEIAVIPVPPARTIEVRLVIYTIYGTILEMMFGDGFYETEVEVLWNRQIRAHVYFTLPMDESPNPKNLTEQDVITAVTNASNLTQIRADVTNPPLNTVFEWRPIYKPGGQNLPPFDIFLLCLGAIKVVAPFPITAKLPDPVHINSELVDANLQVWPGQRPGSRARTAPPFFRYGHMLEAVRRIPGWELARRRFAEFFCGIEANGVPVGVVLLEKGPYIPDLGAGDGNFATS